SLSMGMGTYAEGQRSLPHPQSTKKTRLRAPSSEPTLPKPPAHSTRIRSAGAFRACYPPPMLQKSHVFAMSGKFSLTIRASEAPATPCSERFCAGSGESARRDGDFAAATPHMCPIGNVGLGRLISRRVFFIHQRAGEVAEWSKALPC